MQITASEFLQQLAEQNSTLIDVRSEGEFAKGQLPGAVNIPILNDEHRHLVGLCYKEQGHAAALQLGHRLVDPIRPLLIERWCDASSGKPSFVHCWRGGLRSSLACEWLQNAGQSPICIEGGYKAVRGSFLRLFESRYSLLVVTGFTGAGKTPFLRALPPEHSIDLEQLAHHRGSAFGRLPGDPPAQQSFENALAFELFKRRGPFLIEDESRGIGKLTIPPPFFKQMQDSSYIVLECPFETRIENIYQEYICESGLDSEVLKGEMRDNLQRVQRRIGGALYQELDQTMSDAFECDSKELHLQWISKLLERYYDPLYTERLDEVRERVVFRGTNQESNEFISHYLSRGGAR